MQYPPKHPLVGICGQPLGETVRIRIVPMTHWRIEGDAITDAATAPERDARVDIEALAERITPKLGK